VAVLTERLILKCIECRIPAALSLWLLLVEFDDGEFLLLADVELIDEFVVNFHEFLLEDGDFFLVLAALSP
jgi:hypothetical protein